MSDLVTEFFKVKESSYSTNDHNDRQVRKLSPCGVIFIRNAGEAKIDGVAAKLM